MQGDFSGNDGCGKVYCGLVQSRIRADINGTAVLGRWKIEEEDNGADSFVYMANDRPYIGQPVLHGDCPVRTHYLYLWPYDAGADLTAGWKDDTFGRRMLRQAISFNYADVTMPLLEAGIDPDLKFKEDRTDVCGLF